jgi:hypothetical protein
MFARAVVVRSFAPHARVFEPCKPKKIRHPAENPPSLPIHKSISCHLKLAGERPFSPCPKERWNALIRGPVAPPVGIPMIRPTSARRNRILGSVLYPLVVAVAIWGAAMARAGEKPEPTRFVPPKTYFPAGTFADYAREAYTKYLRVMHEPSLADHKNPDSDVYRLLWMRSFDPPMIFRLEFSVEGSARLTVKKARIEEINHSPEPTKLISQAQRKVTKQAANNFLHLFAASTFSKRPLGDPRDEMLGTDGSTWVFEAVQKGVYHVTYRWSPLPPLVPPGDVPPEFAKFRQKDGEEIALDMASLYLILLGNASAEELY